MTVDLDSQIADATNRMIDWLQAIPEWAPHPINASGSVSAHFGPTILSEHDCVLHFSRHLADAGVAWTDLHLELSPGQWMYRASGTPPKRMDLAIVSRDELAAATLPATPGEFPLDAVFEFALASNSWMHGSGSPGPMRKKVEDDIAKVADYLASGVTRRGFVVVIEECDHDFPPNFEQDAQMSFGVDLVVLKQWERS